MYVPRCVDGSVEDVERECECERERVGRAGRARRDGRCVRGARVPPRLHRAAPRRRARALLPGARRPPALLGE